MKFCCVLAALFMMMTVSTYGADCDCAKELRQDPEFMNEIIQAVRQDLVKNPKILQEMATAMQEHEATEKNEKIRSYISSRSEDIIKNAPVLGNRGAVKTIYIWSDFSCPYCRRVHGELNRVLGERNDVRVVLKNFSIHGELSDGPAKASIAAKLQDEDKAAKFTDLMMTRQFYTQDDLTDKSKLAGTVETNIMNLAKEAGLDTEKLKADMDGDVVSRELSDVRDMAEHLQITGTPFLIVDGKAFPGAIPYEQIIKALDEK